MEVGAERVGEGCGEGDGGVEGLGECKGQGEPEAEGDCGDDAEGEEGRDGCGAAEAGFAVGGGGGAAHGDGLLHILRGFNGFHAAKLRTEGAITLLNEVKDCKRFLEVAQDLSDFADL